MVISYPSHFIPFWPVLRFPQNLTKKVSKRQYRKISRNLGGLYIPGYHVDSDNGLNNETKIRILRIYVLLVLIHGLEVLFPSNDSIQTLNESELR